MANPEDGVCFIAASRMFCEPNDVVYNFATFQKIVNKQDFIQDILESIALSI